MPLAEGGTKKIYVGRKTVDFFLSKDVKNARLVFYGAQYDSVNHHLSNI